MSYIYGAPNLDVSRSHTTTHHSRQDSSGRMINSLQRPLPDNTQHSQQPNIHAPGGIRTHDLNRRAAADVLLRPRGHWDRHLTSMGKLNNITGIRREDTGRRKPKQFVRSCLTVKISTVNTTSTVLGCHLYCRAETPQSKGNFNLLAPEFYI